MNYRGGHAGILFYKDPDLPGRFLIGAQRRDTERDEPIYYIFEVGTSRPTRCRLDGDELVTMD